MNRRLWTSDGFAGLVITVAALAVVGLGGFQPLERHAYDFGVRASSASPSDRIAVIAIDDRSIQNIGPWPWPRSTQGELLNILAQGQPKVIGETTPFTEPQDDAGLAYIRELRDFVNQSSIVRIPSEVSLLGVLLDEAGAGTADRPPAALRELQTFFAGSALKNRLSVDVTGLRQRLTEAERRLNTDLALAAAIKGAGNVVLAMPIRLGQPQGGPHESLPEYATRHLSARVRDDAGAAARGQLPLEASLALAPIAELGSRAAAIGHLTDLVDIDGAVRSDPLVVRLHDQLVPSLSLVLAARSLDLGTGDLVVHLGQGIELGALRIATAPDLQMYNFFYADRPDLPAFEVDSFYDVLTGRVPATKYRDKIVLIGITAAGVAEPQVTPISPAMPPVLTLAHVVSSILNEDFYTLPTWGRWVEIGALGLVAFYLILLLPRLSTAWAIPLTLLLGASLLAAQYYLLTQESLWLRLATPTALLLLGHLFVTAKRLLVAERHQPGSEDESAESDRMLGLALHGQGQLDKAFEKLRRVPIDAPMMEALYNLGLDFERKRQFGKAQAVYQHMAGHNARFRDLETRIKRSRQLAEAVAVASTARGAPVGVSAVEGAAGVQRSMLGRYRIERELGKGAMGTVYLGTDPKIGRTVAIKTMALSQEFEAHELAEVKARFFREAETAGRLNHPSIVTIYDAGEDQDLAYIAMELLTGGNLTRFTKLNDLLPLAEVMELIAKCADALAYAHAHSVVHRDIKPANIMYDPQSGDIKITDFGIARITDSSKTKTGMVLGTPSYMSPEQLAGKKVDGRSDLFSLGTMLFQLTTGQLPFQADSMATLMYKIANEPHPSVRGLRPDAPPCLQAIIDKVLSKNADQRFQDGAEMARTLRACAAAINNDQGLTRSPLQ